MVNSKHEKLHENLNASDRCAHGRIFRLRERKSQGKCKQRCAVLQRRARRFPRRFHNARRTIPRESPAILGLALSRQQHAHGELRRKRRHCRRRRGMAQRLTTPMISAPRWRNSSIGSKITEICHILLQAACSISARQGAGWTTTRPRGRLPPQARHVRIKKSRIHHCHPTVRQTEWQLNSELIQRGDLAAMNHLCEKLSPALISLTILHRPCKFASRMKRTALHIQPGSFCKHHSVVDDRHSGCLRLSNAVHHLATRKHATAALHN